MEKSIALNYHVNLNHLCLQPDQRDRYLGGELAQLLEGIEVPAAVSASAEDLLVIKNEAPDAWRSLEANPAIKIAPSFFSHSLSELHPGVASRSVAIADRILRAVLPADKLLSYGFPPELSILPARSIEEIRRFWAGTIYWDHRAARIAGGRLPPFFSDPEGLAHVVSVRGLRYRSQMHAYLRGMSGSHDLTEALEHDMLDRDQTVPLVACIDLETPGLNEVHGSGIVRQPRVDLFSRLQDSLRRSSLQFTYLGQDDMPSPRPLGHFPMPADNAIERWSYPGLVERLLPHAEARGYWQLLYLSSLSSDYFMVSEKDIVLPAIQDGQSGENRIRGDGPRRRRELTCKLAALATGRSLETVLNEADGNYLAMTHQALVSAQMILEATDA